MEYLQTLRLILLVFGSASGLKINLLESTLSSIKISQDWIMLALAFECKISSWPLTYLGLPLRGNLKTSVFWDLVIDEVSSKLDGKKAFLSLKGRITLIMSYLSHIPYYFLSLFKIPVLVAFEIEKLQRDFL